MYAQELSHSDRIRILIRVNYGYYVVERILMRSFNETANAALRNEVSKNLGYLGGSSLKIKWLELLDNSKTGRLYSMAYPAKSQQ